MGAGESPDTLEPQVAAGGSVRGTLTDDQRHIGSCAQIVWQIEARFVTRHGLFRAVSVSAVDPLSALGPITNPTWPGRFTKRGNKDGFLVDPTLEWLTRICDLRNKANELASSGEAKTTRGTDIPRSAPSHQPMSESERQKAMVAGGLADSIVIAFELRDLHRMEHYYPKNVDSAEIKSLREELTAALERILANPGFEEFRKTYDGTTLAGSSPDVRFAVLAGMLSHWHPDFPKNATVEGVIRDGMAKVTATCQEQMPPDVQKAVARIMEIQITDCRIPHPANDATFQETRRFLQLLREYWGLGRQVVLVEAQGLVSLQPHPLMPLMMNLRLRLEVCFEKLASEEGASGAQGAANGLLDVALGNEPDDLSVVPEWTNGEIAKVDEFIEHTRLKLGSKTYPLTREETVFIQVVQDAISEHSEKVKKAWAALTKKADQQQRELEERNVAGVGPPKTTVQPPSEKPGVTTSPRPIDAAALPEKAKTVSAPQTRSRSQQAASGGNKVDVEFLRTIPDEVHTLLGPSAPSAHCARLRTQIVAAIECHDRYGEAVRKWQKLWDEYFKQLFKKQNQLRQHAERPPREGWQWVDDLQEMLCAPHLFDTTDLPRRILQDTGGGGGWVPANLLKPPCFPPNPMPGGDSSGDTDEIVLIRHYVALAVVHDRLDAYEGRNRARLLAGFELPPQNVRTVSFPCDVDKRVYLQWGKGFGRRSIEKALEAVRRDLEGHSREPEASPVTLKQFMEQYCEPMTSKLLESRLAELQRRSRHGAIGLPAYVGQWSPGKSKYFNAADLRERWPSYRTQFPALPKLKSSRP